MTDEKTPLTGNNSNPDNNFYTGQETSTGFTGSGEISRRILHGLTLVSFLAAIGCTIFGSVQAASAVFALPLFTILMWLFIHLTLLLFARNDQHDFSPPSWFIFFASGHLIMQCIGVMVLTIFNKD